MDYRSATLGRLSFDPCLVFCVGVRGACGCGGKSIRKLQQLCIHKVHRTEILCFYNGSSAGRVSDLCRTCDTHLDVNSRREHCKVN